MSKRVKVNFESVNRGRYKTIHPKEIAESNARVKEEMRDVLKRVRCARP